MVSIKQYSPQSRISLEILKRCSSNLASGLYITKEAKWHLSCRCHDSSYAAGPVLIKTKITRFYRKRGSSTHNNLMGIVKAIWEPCVCRAKPSVPLKKIANGNIGFFTERDWSRECCHGNNIVGVILFLLWCTFLVPSLKNTAPILLEILLIECCTVLVNHLWRHHFPHLHNTKTYISLKRKKIFPKEKCHSSLLRKAFQISNYYFLLHRHFKQSCTYRTVLGKFNYPFKSKITSKTSEKL